MFIYIAAGLGILFILTLLSRRHSDAWLTLFFLLAIGGANAISSAINFAYTVTFTAASLTEVADTATTVAVSFALAATVPRLRWLGLLLGILATLNEFTVTGAYPMEIVSGLLIGSAVILLLRSIFRYFGIFPVVGEIRRCGRRSMS
jgi:hypothetical protein